VKDLEIKYVKKKKKGKSQDWDPVLLFI